MEGLQDAALALITADCSTIKWGPTVYADQYEATSSLVSTDGKYIVMTGQGGPNTVAGFATYDARLTKVYAANGTQVRSCKRHPKYCPEILARKPYILTLTREILSLTRTLTHTTVHARLSWL